jgi:Right handed beta helix region
VLINPTTTVTGPVNADGCNIGVYYSSGKGQIDQAEIYGANYAGVFVNGDNGQVSVNVKNSKIHNIGESPLNGTQHGWAIYYRAFFLTGSATGTISGNTLSFYQKAGIIADGQGTNVVLTDNIIQGQGPIGYIAQNGIQVGYGADASVMGNTVTGHSYIGTNAASGGILVLGGAFYGTCPDGNDCPYTVGTRIIRNTETGNDVGFGSVTRPQTGALPRRRPTSRPLTTPSSTITSRMEPSTRRECQTKATMTRSLPTRSQATDTTQRFTQEKLLP